MNTDDFGKVGVLLGGRSAEREISLLSGQGVLQALQSRGIQATPFDPGLLSLSDLAAQQFDRVFIALHGRYGEDGTIQGALEQLSIPYTGSGVMASAISRDKRMTRHIWTSIGLPMPKAMMLQETSNWQDVVQSLGLPLIVKPVFGGSSLGCTKVMHIDELPEAYARATTYEGAPEPVIAEEFIEGIEVASSLIGEGDQAKVLPAVVIQAPGGNYDYQNKYFSDETCYLCPSRLPDSLEKTIAALALQSYVSLGCRGWARTDLMVRAEQPFLLEINTCPGMTGHSLVPMAAKIAGWEYADLCVEILKMATLD